MANLRDIKSRIRGVKSSQKITKAMKMVATSRFRKAEEKLVIAREYLSDITSVMNEVGDRISSITFDLNINHDTTSNMIDIIFVITSDKGLCGSMNTNILKQVKKILNNKKDVILYCIGKKGYDILRPTYRNIILNENPILSSSNFDDIMSNISVCIKDLITRYGSYNINISIIYSRFISIISHKIQHDNIIYLSRDIGKNTVESKYEIEVNDASLQNTLYNYIAGSIYCSILETVTSEQSSRIIAMDAATNNANEIAQKLTLIYNRIRQNKITSEITEIISGVEAV